MMFSKQDIKNTNNNNVKKCNMYIYILFGCAFTAIAIIIGILAAQPTFLVLICAVLAVLAFIAALNFYHQYNNPNNNNSDNNEVSPSL